MKYKQPGSVNVVSFALLATLGLLAYVVVCLWPVYVASSRAKAILLDNIPALYKANLRSAEVTEGMLEDIKTGIATELDKAGINSKGAKILLSRSPKEIALEVRFKATAHFPFPDKSFEFDLSPKVVSDATRIDW